MQKAIHILLLATAFFAIAGTRSTTFAQGPSSFAKLTGLPKLSFITTEPKNNCPNGFIASTDICLGLTGTPTPIKIQQKSSPTPEPTTYQTQINTAPITYVAPTITNEPTIIPTVTVTPTQAPITSAPPTTQLDSEKIFGMVNAYRTSQGLASFEENADVCSLAQIRSTEIPGEIQHGTLHSGLYNRNLPYWIWENAKYGSDEAGTVAWWLASHIHHASIVGDYKYSCVKCANTYCSELFTSFVPK